MNAELPAFLAGLQGHARHEQWSPDAVRLLERTGARLAQLEKVAELARAVLDSPHLAVLVRPRDDALMNLDLALVDLDHHPDTKADD